MGLQIHTPTKSVSNQKLCTAQPKQEEQNQNFIAMDIS
jgi:hypothetical protein